VDEDGWHLSTDAAEKLGAEAQAGLERPKGWLARRMRTTRLPDLLIEVDNDLRFTDHFLPPARRGGRKPDAAGQAGVEGVDRQDRRGVPDRPPALHPHPEARPEGFKGPGSAARRLKDNFAAIWSLP
jgi:hypothetical protein